MKSMTGYGWAEEQGAEVSLSVEIKGCNSRFLDIAVNVPPFLSSLEIPVREYLAGRCRRGRVEVSLRYRELNAPVSVRLNKVAARAYWKAALETAETLGINETPRLTAILGMEGVLETERDRNPQRALERIMPLLERAAADFERDRVREGEHTRGDILSHIGRLERSRDSVAARGAELEKLLRENVRNRFAELLGEGVDENRVYAETAGLLIKHTIAEELSRLEAHLKEFRAEAERNPSPGKKLDFLCQEINREINTIGSKAFMIEVSGEVITMKEALENIREQLRNVE
ncbi:MAG: YicC family protein [Treponema sp.]|jgi:uncharacterized protein (TIGR00255 family)|nr:YicC family protein [Treponema sp.]